MPSLSTLVDDFNDGIIGPDWGNSYGGVTESGGRGHIPCTTAYAGYQTAYSWTMAGAAFYVAVTTVPAASTATEAYIGVFVNAPGIGDNTDPNYGNRIGFVINAVTGQLRCKNDSGYYDAASVDLTYSATAHKFLRLREDGTSLYWDTSPDGSTWTNQRTLATPTWVTAATDQVALDLSAHRDAGTGDEATIDYFNTLSDAGVQTAAASLTAQSALTGTAQLAATGVAALAADSAATGSLLLSAQPTATLAGTGTLTVDIANTGIPEVAALAAGDWDLNIEQGSTFVQTYTVVDDPAFTWAGWGARAQIRTAPADNGDLLLDLTPYLTISGAAVQLAIPATETQALTRNGVWDLEMYQDATVVRLLNGKVIVSLEVTR